ncbi:Gluconate kinase [Aphelenchoides besseyi]|nr:Gluconate kinase [Aphelenchoides besseyi]
MFSLDVVSDAKEETIDGNENEEKVRLISIHLADQLNLSQSYRPIKQVVLELLGRIQQHEVKFAKTSTQFYRRGAKKVLVNPVACTHFCLYCQALKTADAQLFIDPSPACKVTLLFLIQRFVEFFFRNLSKIGGKEVQLWDKQLCKLGLTKVDASIGLSVQAITSERMLLCRMQMKTEKIVRNQKQMRKVAIERDKSINLPELNWDPLEMKQLELELMRTELLDMDDALRQAIERGIYLLEVKRKALDLHSDGADGVDPNKAVVKIQAITRGHLVRKRVKKLREEEAQVLGMNTEALLKERTAARHPTVNSLPQSLFQPLKSLSMVDIPVDFKWPKTFSALIDILHNNFYITDPFDELNKTTTAKSVSDQKLHSKSKNSNREVEAALNRLMGAEIAVLGYDDEKTRPLDEMISYEVECRVTGEIFFFDLRNILYMLIVMPSILFPWSALHVKRNIVLLTGQNGSGKHSWINGMAQKVGAVRITLNNKTLAKRRRTKTIKEIKLCSLQLTVGVFSFCSSDRNAFVIFEQLDFFNEKNANKGSPFKNFYREFMKTFIDEEQLNCQMIGISTKPHLEPEVLALFNTRISISNPRVVERYELIADDLSRRQEESKLSKIPQHLTELSRTTKSMSCADTLETIGKKCSRKR